MAQNLPQRSSRKTPPVATAADTARHHGGKGGRTGTASPGDAEWFRAMVTQIGREAIFSVDLQGVITTWNRGCEHIFGYAEAEFIGLAAVRLYTAEGADGGALDAEFKAAAGSGAFVSDERWMVRKNGERFRAAGSTTPLYGAAGNLLGYAMVLRESAGQLELHGQLRGTVQRLQLLSDAARNLLETDNPLELLDRSYTALAAAFGVDVYLHFVVETGTRALRVGASRGLSPEAVRQIESMPLGESVCGAVSRDLQARVIDDVQQSRKPLTRFIREAGITAYACYPLVAGGRLLGTLAFGTRRYPAFSPEFIDMGRSLADMMAEAMARQQADQALEASAAKFRLVVEAAPNGMVMVDERGFITMVNAQMERLFGYGRDEMLGRPIEMLLPGRYRARHPEQREAFFVSPQARAMGHGRDLFGRRKDGSEFPVEVGLNPAETPEGRVVLAAVIDITERKRTEATVEASAAQFRLVVEAAPNGMVMVDDRGAIIMVNAQMERLFGYERSEMLGQPIELLLPERYRARHPGQRQEFYTSPQTRAMGHGRDLFGRRKDGSEFPVEVGLNPAEMPGGRVVLAAVIDITERKRTEAALANAHAELADYARKLESAVADRTAHLEATIAELEGVSYSLSHDMRGPLRTIQGFSQIVLSDAGDKLGDQEKELLRKTINAANRLDRLIQDVLTYTRVTRQSVALGTVNVEQLLRQIIDERPEFQAPNAVIEIDGPLALVRGHEASLTQCITNLLDNAVKFVAPGRQPHVRIWNSMTENRVKLWFEDNGIGIPQEAQSRLFGIFQRVHDDRKYPGTGIGLAIVRKAVERMGGTVSVESAPGRGSRFGVELPRGTAP
jgi:PAS domain S-box-containing protein